VPTNQTVSGSMQTFVKLFETRMFHQASDAVSSVLLWGCTRVLAFSSRFLGRGYLAALAFVVRSLM
jgi:hypothetical protein